MKEKQTLEEKLKSLQRGQSFTVASETERQTVSRIAKTLTKFGHPLPYTLVTKKSGKEFIVAAI